MRFGRLGGAPEKQVKSPGIHFSLPFFIDEVIKIPVQTVHEVEVVTHYGTGDSISPDIEKNGYMLTGDNNVVLVKAVVKYTIDNIAKYALYMSDAGKVIDGIVSGELTRLVTRLDIDSVLTVGRASLSSEVTENSQVILDRLDTGIMITGIELTDIVPPAETRRYFDSVISAAVNRETTIQRARETARNNLLTAETRARNLKGNAVYQQTGRLTRARNEMSEFDGLHEQYTKTPQIIAVGNFMQKMTGVFRNMGGVVIVPESGDPPVIILR